MAKRSPILGYNHNVRYRGLIFHVQTEDSGLINPHLFTHLFYEGVIISSRKLVYDAGSAEDAIKGLMQAQHKVALKELKGGKFDDKIDEYLGGTPGLTPREGESEIAPPRRSDPALAPPRPSETAIPLTPRPSDPEISIELGQSGSVAVPPAVPPTEVNPTLDIASLEMPELEPVAPPKPTRTKTAERGSGSSRTKTASRGNVLPPPPPPLDELDPPTLTDDTAASIAEAIAAANATVPTQVPFMAEHPGLELDSRESELAMAASDGVPGSIGASASGHTYIPGTPLPPAERRGSSVDAAPLPPGRPVNRPSSRQALTPPSVVSRPVSNSEPDSDSIEVYAAAPPSAETPPGAAPERPGQYAQHKRSSQRMGVERTGPIPIDRTGPIPIQRTGPIPIPSGLGRPNRPSSSPSSSGPIPKSAPHRPSSPSSPVPHAAPAPPPGSRPIERPRTPTPARVAGPAPSRAASSGNSGVVMTRPAVIVGAPPKLAANARVRKAREEEGRGFGQGLISEKSLDEVILAYLSEDAKDE